MSLHLIKHINYMALAQAANYVLPLILIPYLVQILGLGGFGDFSVSQSIINVGIIVVQFGLNIYVTKDIAERKVRRQPIEEILSTALVLQITLAVTLIGAAYVVYAVVPGQITQLSFLYSFAWLGQALFPVWYFQGSQLFKHLALLNFLLRMSTLVLVLALIRREEHLVLLPLIYSFSYLAVGLSACGIMWQQHTLQRPLLPDLVVLVNRAKDVFLSNIVGVLLMNMPIFFLSHLVSKEEVGAFSAILRVINAIKGMLNSGFQVLLPALVSERGPLDHVNIIQKLCLLLLPILGLLMAVREPFQTFLYGRSTSFDHDLEYLILIASILPGAVATLFMFVFATYHGQFLRRKHAFISVFIVAALLYYPFIHVFNGLGAAVVVVISEIVLLICGIRMVWNMRCTQKVTP